MELLRNFTRDRARLRVQRRVLFFADSYANCAKLIFGS
jgi:hypothetical protein